MELPALQIHCGLALLLLQLLLCTVTVRGGCDLAADRARTEFYGHCPCSCQTAEGFSCTSCPLTCRRYYERCKPSTACLSPPPPTAGVSWRPVCNQVPVGAKCYGDCQPGYIGLGGTSQCTESGWTRPKNKCSQETASGTPLDAVEVPEIAAAGLASSSSTAIGCQGLQRRPVNTLGWPQACRGLTVGSLCTAQCKPGFTGQATTRCQENGTWRAAVNTCTLVNGTVSSPEQMISPTSAGAVPASSGALETPDAAVGGASTGLGVSSFCVDLPEPLANTKSWPQSCAGSRAGSRCTAECQEGYQGVAFTICPMSGIWAAPVNLCKLPATCKGSPPNLLGVRWNPCDGLPQGSVCTAPCGFGFTGAGYTAVCGPDGSWQKPSQQCIDVLCQGSPQITAGVKWPDCTGHRVGESCVASSCSAGFRGTGAIGNCMPDGSWYDIWTDCTAR